MRCVDTAADNAGLVQKRDFRSLAHLPVSANASLLLQNRVYPEGHDSGSVNETAPSVAERGDKEQLQRASCRFRIRRLLRWPGAVFQPTLQSYADGGQRVRHV